MEIDRKIECLDGAVFLLLWPGAARQTAEEAGRRFPYAVKPQEVYADGTGRRILALNLLEEGLEDGQVESAIAGIQKIIEKLYPGSIWHKARCMAAAKVTAGWFSFVTGSLAGEQFHILFLLPMEGRMLLGSWHSLTESIGKETADFLEMLKSIRIRNAIKTYTGEKQADARVL